MLSNKLTLSIFAGLLLVGCNDTVQETPINLETVRYEVECEYCWLSSYEYRDSRGWSHENYTELDSSFNAEFRAPEGQNVAGFIVHTSRFVVDSIESTYRPGQFVDSVFTIQDTVVTGSDTTYVFGDTLFLNRVTIHEKIQDVVGTILVNDSIVHQDTLTGERLEFTL